MSRGIWKNDTEPNASQRVQASRRILALPAILALTVVVLETPVLAETSTETWPRAVQAHYRLRFNGFDIGHVNANSNVDEKTYSMTGSGKFSALFGAVTWIGSSSASGAIAKGAPQPSKFAFNWSNHRKHGHTRVGFKERVASEISIEPPPDPHTDIVPLAPGHKEALDPISAILTLTKADRRPPCERTARIFDGKQRYDLVLTPKRLTNLPGAAKGSPPEIAHVCRVMYVPVAGHRDNAATKTYASNKDVEVVMRRIPDTELMIPYSVTVPTFWGTGSMVADRIEVTTASGNKVAFAK